MTSHDSKVSSDVVVSKRKFMLAIVSIVIICVSIFVPMGYVIAQGGGSTPITISSGVYPGAPSYTIYTDGTTYYAKDQYGHVAWSSSTDAGTVLQQTINDVSTDGGGTIHVTAGVYTFTSSIVITTQKGWSIVGEGSWGYLPSAETGTVFEKDFDGTLFDIDYGSYGVNSFRIEQVAFIPVAGHTGGCISIEYATRFILQDLMISRGDWGIKIDNSQVHRLQNIVVDEQTSGYGIYYNNTYDWQWYYVEVDDVNQQAGFAAARLDNSHGMIIGGHFEGWRGLDVRAGTGASSISISDMMIPYAIERGIYVDAGNIFELSNSKVYGANEGAGFTGKNASTIYSLSNNIRISNSFIGAWTDDSPTAIWLDCNDANIVGNTIAKNVYIDGISNSLTSNTMSNLTLNKSNNRIVSNSLSNCTININSQYNSFVSNNFGTVPIVTGGYNSFKSNIGYVTEVSNSSIVADGDWIDTGLPGPSNFIALSPEANVMVWPAAYNGSLVQVRFMNTTSGTTPGGNHAVLYHAIYGYMG